MVNRRFFGVLMVSVTLAACGGGEGGAEGEVVESDTTAIQGQDTVNVPTVVPTTDSVVTTTTVDTMHGEAHQDSTQRDSAPRR